MREVTHNCWLAMMVVMVEVGENSEPGELRERDQEAKEPEDLSLHCFHISAVVQDGSHCLSLPSSQGW